MLESWASGFLSSACPPSWGAGGGEALRLGIAGSSGSGKSSLMRELITKTRHRSSQSRSLVFAPMPAPYGFTCRTRGEAARSLSMKHSVTIIQNPGLFLSLMPAVMERGSIMLWVDEAHEVFPRTKPDPMLHRILLEGRNRGIGLVWSTQRPTRCHVDVLGVSQGIVLGRLIAPADIAYSRQWGVIQPLPMFHFKAILPGCEVQDVRSKKYN